MSEQDQPTTFDVWAIVEMLGHRRVIGHVTEQVIAGSGFIRVDSPGPDGSIAQTQFVAPASVYAITPISEFAARLATHSSTPEPVTVWDLPEHIRLAIRQSSEVVDDNDGGPF
jgi:hypothetical protein